MLELTGFGSVLRGIGFLYWVLAIGAVFLAFKYGKGTRGKVIWAAVAIVAFGYLPGKAMIEQHQRDAYAKEAWAYFKKLCDEKSGEKIYKTFTGVKSVLVVKPLPPATEKDLYDQFWYGDPYSASATSMRVDNAAGTLVYPDAPISMNERGKGFEFVESYTSQDKSGQKNLIKYSFQPAARDYRTESTTQSISRFGVSWEDISKPEDRKFWVAGSRLSIVDLNDKSLVAERIGYFIEAGFGSVAGGRRPWLTSRGPNTTCPPIQSGDYADRWFILKVLNPIEGKQDGK
jgi:hypothetical protein